jgi:hypothetical protein
VDGALETAADCQFLCGDGAFYLGAIINPDNGSVKLAFDATKDTRASGALRTGCSKRAHCWLRFTGGLRKGWTRAI